MDNFEQATPAERQEQLVDAVCWECGAKAICAEFIVCCTGTLFHVCAACEAKVDADVPAVAAPAN